MEKRCCNCFELYEDIDGMCPHCGYTVEDDVETTYVLKPGTVLKNNKYMVGQIAGQGGFGIIYKAWDTNLQRVVAIKEFFPLSMAKRGDGQTQVGAYSSKQEQDYEKHLAKFRREAKIMSLFTDSVNCIKTYDVFEENGTAYIVMEYCDAPTLKEYIKEKKDGTLPEGEVINIVSQVLSGLQEIHAKGVYHLDIALDNIFIKKNGKDIKITIYDFGAARLEKDLKRRFDDEIILKPGFAPPEQYKKNGKIGPWTDIYAVGANMYYLLTGVVPMEATDREHEDVMEEPAQLNMVSPAVNNATLRAMALNPELRYKSAKEYLEDLKKEKVRSAEDELRHRRKVRRSFIVTMSAVLILAIATTIFFGYTKGKILEDEITMWVASDFGVEMERERYEAVIKVFNEHYPQVHVNLEIMETGELKQRFLNAKKKERPDILETTHASANVLELCESLSDIYESHEGELIEGLSEKLVAESEKQIPLGFYVTMIYKQSGAEMEQLTEVVYPEFIKNATGYVRSDTTIYSQIQENVAGRYELEESEQKELYLTDEFSIFSRGINKEKAAKALLNYMLTDVGQENLHITHKSDYIPVSRFGFELYVSDVFSELDFLKQSIGEYELK